MKKQYLHLSAYVCLNCFGPVISGTLAVRENEISQETGIKKVGAICLACGQRQDVTNDSNCVREFSPIEWVSEGPAGADYATISPEGSARAA
jgi:hypothetical protein